MGKEDFSVLQLMFRRSSNYYVTHAQIHSLLHLQCKPIFAFGFRFFSFSFNFAFLVNQALYSLGKSMNHSQISEKDKPKTAAGTK